MRNKDYETWHDIWKTRGFKIAILNIARLPSHLEEIRLILHKKNRYFSASWTRLNPSISDGLVNVDGYDILLADGNKNRGGVCIYVRCDINDLKRPDLVPNDLEAIFVKIKQENIASPLLFQVFIDHEISKMEDFKTLKTYST